MNGHQRQLYDLLGMYQEVRSTYLKLYSMLGDVRDGTKTTNYDVKEMVNMLYVLRETLKYHDDICKEIRAVSELLEKVTCLMYMQEHIDDDPPIHASLATGTARMRMVSSPPHPTKERERYIKMLKSFGVDDHIIETGVLNCHWVRMGDYITKLCEEGKPLPPGVDPDKTIPKYSVSIRGAWILDELLQELQEADKDQEIECKARKEDARTELMMNRPKKKA